MTWAEIFAAIGGFLGTAAVIVGGWLTYRATIGAKQIESKAAPYDQLAERVSALEGQVKALLSDQWVDRTYMRQVLAAWPAGLPLPMPMPSWLAEHYGLSPQHPPTPGSLIQPPRPKE